MKNESEVFETLNTTFQTANKPLELRSHWVHFGKSQSGWITSSLYASISWETKTMHTKLIPETAH